MVKVSIIVPVYNVENYLDRCMSSLINQTLKDIEIILVDDNSPDNSPSLCDKWGEMDNRVKVVHKSQNEGLGFARNTGLDYATGEYVAFLDSDDYVDQEAYETVYRLALKGNLDVCYFQRRRVDQNGKRIEISSQKTIDTYIGRDDVDRYMLNLIGHKPSDSIQRIESFSVCMGIMRTSIIERYHCRFPSEKEVASEDLLFQMDFLPHVERVSILPNVFYNYYINSASITQNYDDAKRDRMKCLLKEIRFKLENSNLSSCYEQHYYSQVLRIYRTILRFESRSRFPFFQKIRRIKNECASVQLQSLFLKPVISSYPRSMQVYLYAMKYKASVFFVVYYALKKDN